MANKKNSDTLQTLRCVCCGDEQRIVNFYKSDSEIYKAIGYAPYCKDCIEKLYDYYSMKYAGFGYKEPERWAIERLCMIMDVYYGDSMFKAASANYAKEIAQGKRATLFSSYIRRIKLNQYRGRDYDTTIRDKDKIAEEEKKIRAAKVSEEMSEENAKAIEAATLLFGKGFEEEDYLFLYDQYTDWTMRHECKTKAQEEVFKQICFTQLELLKATRARADTKDLTATFQKLLETAKLQPKQNSGDAVSDAQTFGTLIDKWENTRPLPEVDEELKDVDKIGLYIDVFFRGHLAKMLNIKGGLSNLYSKFMRRYTVNKPEYNADDMDEAAFDAIFGNADMDSESGGSR